MSDKVKAISSFVISAVGWLVFVGGILYEKHAPIENEFSSLINFAVFMQFARAATVIHVINCILGIVFLVQKTRYKKLCITGLLSSSAFIVFCVAPYLYLVYAPSNDEEPERELDVRWKEYTKDRQTPTKEIQLSQDTAFLIFSKSPTGQKFLYASIMSEGRIDYVDLAAGEHLLTLEGHQGGTHSLSFSPDGRKAVSGGKNGGISLWDIDKGVKIGHVKGHKSYVRSIAYSPVDNQALSGDDSGEILLWDLDTMQIIKKFGDHYPSVGNKSLVWGSDGKTFLSASSGPTIRLWDIDTGEERSRLQVNDAMIVSIALSPNGKYALSSHCNGPEQPVIYWDLESEQEINRFGVPGNPWHADRMLHVESVAFSSNGETALFGLKFGTAIWWDLNEWKAIAMNRLFDKELVYVYFSEDDNDCIAVGCDESTVYEKAKVRYWELKEQGD